MNERHARIGFHLRQLGGSDATDYRALRLLALHSHPDAFSASWEDEAAQPLSEFAIRLEQNVVFGGFKDEALFGIVGFRETQSDQTSRIGLLWGMFVHPHARGTGLAEFLVESVIEQAKTTVVEIRLSVAATNAAAVKLYARLGFQEFGLEKRPTKAGEGYTDDLLMALQIKG